VTLIFTLTILKFYQTRETRKGNIKHSLVLKIPFNRNNVSKGLIGMHINVTQQKEAEKALEQALNMTQIFRDSLPYPVYMKDEHGVVKIANTAFAEYFGLKHAEVVGKKSEDIMPKEAARIDSEYDYLVKKKGKLVFYEIISGERISKVIKFPIPNGGIGCMTVDITKEKADEAKKAELNEENIRIKQRYDAFFHASKHLMFIKDADGRYVLFNRATKEYFDPNNEIDLFGKTDFDIMPHEAAVACVITDKKAIDKMDMVVNTEKVNGETFQTTKFPIIDDTGRVGVGAIIENITKAKEDQGIIFKYAIEMKILNDELAEKNRELQALNKTKDTFFSIIAHDLKNPLSTLKMGSDQLISHMESCGDSEASLLSLQINRTVDGLISLLDDLLTWARMQNGSMPFKPEDISVNELSEITKYLLAGNASKKNITVEIDIMEQIFAFADLNMVNTIVRNLLSNAIKFTGNEGHIRISAEEVNGEILIAVSDNGMGIKKEDLGKLFRIDSHHTTIGTGQEKGTGLGLALCKDFAEKNGGRIWVESEDEKGTTFFFTLPKSKLEPQ